MWYILLNCETKYGTRSRSLFLRGGDGGIAAMAVEIAVEAVDIAAMALEIAAERWNCGGGGGDCGGSGGVGKSYTY